jgi:hypothetical protein
MPIDTKESKSFFYQYLPINNSIEMNYNESYMDSSSIKFNLKEVNNNFPKKGNQKSVSQKYFQSLNAYNSGKSKKIYLINKKF